MIRFRFPRPSWMPTPIEIAVALAIVMILLSYHWITLPPAACAHLKPHTVVRTAWDGFWFWWSTGCR